MNKFLSKIVLYALSYLALLSVVALLIPYPYYWGNPWYSSKAQYLERQDQRSLPDTYFFGSSRIYRHIDPQVFDSVFYRSSGRSIQSFNFGAPATFVPQSYFLYEKFLASGLSREAKFAFIELSDIKPVASIQSDSDVYWHNLSDLVFLYRATLHNPWQTLTHKANIMATHLMAFTKRIFLVKPYGQQLLDSRFYDENYVGPHHNGYYALESELATTQNEVIHTDIRQRRKDLLQDSLALSKRARLFREYLTDTTGAQRVDQVHLDRINQLIAQSRVKGIRLIFLLPPRTASRNLASLYRVLPEEHKLPLSGTTDYAAFHTMEYSFDIGHLNRAGAIQYSTLLAQKFHELLN